MAKLKKSAKASPRAAPESEFKSKSKKAANLPKVSIVVRMYNEALHLEKLFTELKKQSLQDFEVIAVDSGSTDGSLEIAHRYCDQVISIQSEDFTFGFSLNQGIHQSKGSLIAIISAHTYPLNPDWLTSLVEGIEESPDYAMAYGKQVGVKESKLAEKNDFALYFAKKRVVQSAPDYHCNNANSMIRKDLWEIHPFDESLTGLEDQGWSKHWMDQGKKIVYVPQAGIAHIHNETWHQVENRYFREAVAARHIGLQSSSALPGEVLKLGKRYLEDLKGLLRGRDLKASSVKQLTQYRYCQLRGVVRGLTHEVEKKEFRDLFFPDKNPAIVIYGPNQARLESIPLPTIKPNDVLIRVSTVGICATDLEVYRGTLGYFQNGMSKYPIVPGHEYCGEVVAVGAKVGDHLKPGTRVVGECILTCMKCEACKAGRTIACKSRREVGVMNHNGAYASFVALPSHFVHPILNSKSALSRYALVEPLAVVHKALSRLPSSPGRIRKVGITGAGPIGNLTAQLLEREGHEVTLFDINASRLEALSSKRIHRETKIAGLDRFDTVVETTGKASVLEEVLAESAPDSEILLLGLPYGDSKFNFENIVSYDRKVIGSVGSSSKDFKAAIELIPDLDLDPFFLKVHPVADYQSAWEDHESQKYLKVMITHET